MNLFLSYKELMDFLLRFSMRSPGPIGRSALYLQLDDRKLKTDQDLPKWVPSRRMLLSAFGISPESSSEIGHEATYFLEQALIGVRSSKFTSS